MDVTYTKLNDNEVTCMQTTVTVYTYDELLRDYENALREQDLETSQRTAQITLLKDILAKFSEKEK